MTQLKQEIAAYTNRFRQGYEDETIFLSMLLEGKESLYGSPPKLFFFNEVAGFETSSPPYLLKVRAPLPPRPHRSIVVVAVVFC